MTTQQFPETQPGQQPRKHRKGQVLLIAAVVLIVAGPAIAGLVARAGRPSSFSSAPSGPSQAEQNAAYQRGYSFADRIYLRAYQAIAMGYSKNDAAYCAWSLTAGWAGPDGHGGPLTQSYLKGCVKGLIANGVN